MRRSARTGQYHSVRQRRCYQVAAVAAPALLVLAYAPLRGAMVAGVVVQAVLLELLLLVGPASMTVAVDDAGVTVRNMFKTVRIGWADVRGFHIDDGFPWIARVERASGPEVIAWAISAEPWLSWGAERRRILAMVDDLNRSWRQAVLAAGRPSAVRVVPAAAPAAPDPLGVESATAAAPERPPA